MSGKAPQFRFTWKHAIVAAVVLAALVGVTIATAPYFSRERLESFVRGHGAWGPLILLGLQIAQILIAPIPGVFMPLLAGALYGPVLGVLIAAGGTVIGSALAYFIGNRAGVPLLRRWIGKENVDRAQNLVGGKRWIVLVLLFLMPFTPADAICFVSGMIGIPLGRFALAVLIGRVPKDGAIALAGAGLIHLGSLISK